MHSNRRSSIFKVNCTSKAASKYLQLACPLFMFIPVPILLLAFSTQQLPPLLGRTSKQPAFQQVNSDINCWPDNFLTSVSQVSLILTQFSPYSYSELPLKNICRRLSIILVRWNYVLLEVLCKQKIVHVKLFEEKQCKI